MKFLRTFSVFILLSIALAVPASAWIHGLPILTFSRSELVLGPGGTEYKFLNVFKGAGRWTYVGSPNTTLTPDQLDANGYPLFGGAWASNSGARTLITAPSQAERPGHYVLTWTGGGKFAAVVNGTSGSVVACIGTSSGTSPPSCDNSACSSFTASIAATTLTVTASPTGTGCILAPGVPISGAGVLVSKFGTPTIVTSAGSSCGGNTCYTVNQSQTVISGTMNIGGRFETSVGTTSPGDDITSTNAQWLLEEISTVNGNQASNFAFYHVADEAAWEASATPCGSGQACILSSLFKTRMQQGNFAVIRDLNVANSNISNCTTWASRHPILYSSWVASEMRNAASGAGQYVNATGTGATGGTVSYNAGTDVYSITLGSGNFVDKQTIIMLAPATGTTSSKVSLNGNTAVPILGGFGAPLANSFGSFIPQNAGLTTLVYDAVLNGALSFGGSTKGDVGLNCGIPPEAFVELNAELNMAPWHTPGVMSLDPMTDWVSQYATYIKANYAVKPIFEATNEPWNCGGGPYNPTYMSAKSAVYISEDSAWTSGAFCGAGGNTANETGKIASTMGQDLFTILGVGNFELLTPVQTFGATSSFNDSLRSTSYVNQTIAPTQPGYTQTAAYQYATRVSVNNYWSTGWYGTQSSTVAGLEAGNAYCYYSYSISTTCQGLYASQAAVMTAKMNTSTISNATLNITALVARLAAYNTWGSNCSFGAGSRPGNCTVNQSFPLMLYEGGFNEGAQTADVTQSATSATNANPAVLAITNNGCVAGQTIAISALSGGTWSAAAGSYTVQLSGTDGNHCAINLDSTGLGTLSAATLTYTGSANYVTYTRQSAYLAPEGDTLTTTLYNDVLANGGVNPSQFQLGDTYNTASNQTGWEVWAFDIYGYFTRGKCTLCTIASSTLTLGGTITGTFSIGQTLFGDGVTGVGTGAGTNTTITACTPVGANVCGTTAGDTLGLSQASTVTSGKAMTGNATPPANNAGNSTTSPIRAWGAICRWNNNGSQCNG